MNTAQFIAASKVLHGEKYDYSTVDYTARQDAVLITCRIHGCFEQIADNHLRGKGCYKCGRASFRAKMTFGKSEFVARAQAAHGHRYDYSLVEYAGNKTAVKIICPAHGMFKQKASGHMGGSGCKKCTRSIKPHKDHWVNIAKGRTAILYFLRFFRPGEEFFKAGITYHSVKHRYRDTVKAGHYQYEVLGQHTSTNAAAVYGWEQSILETFAHLRYTPRTRFRGASECFSEAEPILAVFPL